MKIEMGESIIYSWLRHEKLCQITQTNWKSSNYWEVHNRDELSSLLDQFQQFYIEKYQFDITKGSSIDQLLKQAEIDVLGIAHNQGYRTIYAVDIAYHESGLSYGDKAKTLLKIIQKCVRSAFCLHGYFDVGEGEIIFASPKINPAIETELSPMLIELNDLFAQSGLGFRVQLYCNSTFEMQIMQPVLKKLKFIADTNELFVRSVQMYQMFAQSDNTDTAVNAVKAVPSSPKTETFEGKAISRIPKWASAPTQNNHKIIRAYLQLQEEHGSVNRPDLERRCQQPERYPDVYVADFKGNFNSMKTDKANNHGKVFTDDGYHIGIWEAVAAVIEQYKPMFLA